MDLSIREWCGSAPRPVATNQKLLQAVAGVIATIDTDVLTLTEVGSEVDVLPLVNSVRNLGVDYPHVAVCNCNDPTGQHVAVLSKIPFVSGSILLSLPGREGYQAASWVNGRLGPESDYTTGVNISTTLLCSRPEGEVNDQDHRAGGTTRVIVDKPRTSNEANDVEKPKI